MTRSRTKELDALSDPRLGVLARADLVKAGFRPDLASYEVAAGRWQRLLPGVYLRGRQPPTLEQRCFAASLHAGSKAVITGRAGCELRGVLPRDPEQDEITVLVPSEVQRVSSGFCHVVRTSRIPPHEVLRRGDLATLPVAHTARCATDAIRRMRDLGQARALAVALLRSKTFDWGELTSSASRPGPGSGHLIRVVRDIADGVRSPAEADVNDAVARAARRGTFPPYLLNPDVLLNGVLIGSPDLWVVGLGLGGEVDSREWHGEADALDRTLLRHERFTEYGLHLHHTTPARFHQDPRAHLSKLRGLVADRRRLPSPEPPGLVVLGRGPLLPARSPWPQVAPNRWVWRPRIGRTLAC